MQDVITGLADRFSGTEVIVLACMLLLWKVVEFILSKTSLSAEKKESTQSIEHDTIQRLQFIVDNIQETQKELKTQLNVLQSCVSDLSKELAILKSRMEENL